jgi:outer membrane protein assembly factor BamB
MRRIRFSFLIYLASLPALCLGDLVPFNRAAQTGNEFTAVFEWGEVNDKFMLTAKGVLSSKTDTAKPKLKLPIAKGSWIEHLFVLTYNNDLMLAFETNDGDEGNGYICRIKSPLAGVDWCQSVAGFNVYAAASTNTIYLGAIGFVSRINPENGKLLWHHADLYNKDNTFNIVCPAHETESAVTFNATTGIKGLEVKQITLDRQTGKIMQIAVIPNNNVCQ